MYHVTLPNAHNEDNESKLGGFTTPKKERFDKRPEGCMSTKLGKNISRIVFALHIEEP